MFNRIFCQVILVIGLCFGVCWGEQSSGLCPSGKLSGSTTRKKIQTELKGSYKHYYRGRDELTIKSIEETDSNEIGVKLTLEAHSKGFSHFLISTNESKFVKSGDGVIKAEFKIGESSAQKKYIVVKLVSKDGAVAGPYNITLICNANKFWASRGAKGYPNWITVKSYPYLEFGSCCAVENWIYKRPTDEEKKYAKEKWGKLVEGAETDYEKAKLLAKSLMDDLKPHIGVPSDAMKAPPFVQYERMVSGKDKGFCTNLAKIFIHACNSLGIPTRRIHLEKVHSRGEKFSVRMGGMHSTTEIFDEKLNQWVWIDLTYNVIGAYLGEEGPLNAMEFGLFLNQQGRRKRLRVLYYNYKDKLESMYPVAECPQKEFASLDGWDTEFHYFYSKSSE